MQTRKSVFSRTRYRNNIKSVLSIENAHDYCHPTIFVTKNENKMSVHILNCTISYETVKDQHAENFLWTFSKSAKKFPEIRNLPNFNVWLPKIQKSAKIVKFDE